MFLPRNASDGPSGPAGTAGRVGPDLRAPAGDAEPDVSPGLAEDATPPAAAGPTLTLSATAHAAGGACVQCGLCLPACPTYLETGNEADGPRGRIRQMLGLHDGDVALTPAGRGHLERCLDCRACETACPSGVEYHKLLEDARSKLAADPGTDAVRPDGMKSGRLTRLMMFHLFPYPQRLRAATAPARVLQKLGLWGLMRRAGVFKVLPGPLARMSRLLPDAGDVWPRPLPVHCRAGGMDLVVSMLDYRKATGSEKVQKVVGFFEGCVAQVMAADVHRKAAELLCAGGMDVVTPPEQVCCGAIHLHNHDPVHARKLARQNLDVFCPADGPRLDYVVTATAGDGAMLRQYPELLADDPVYADRARDFASRVRDVTEVLDELTLPFNHPQRVRVTYHDACHLAHGQKVTGAPRRLLAKVPGLELVELPESDVCCGAAGTYNLTQPEMAAALAARKLDRIGETGCTIVASGNVGCTMHLAAAARDRRADVRVVHPVEILHAAVFGGEV